MPLYDYACSKCDHAFEALVFNGEEVECPECHGTRVKRQLSMPAKPATEGSSSACASDLPPCGPACCRM